MSHFFLYYLCPHFIPLPNKAEYLFQPSTQQGNLFKSCLKLDLLISILVYILVHENNKTGSLVNVNQDPGSLHCVAIKCFVTKVQSYCTYCDNHRNFFNELIAFLFLS